MVRQGSNGLVRRWGLAAACCAAAALSCAQQGFPPGGPADETHPAVTQTVPAPQAIDVPVTGTITFTFSEPMDGESVESNFFLVPIPEIWPSFEWREGGRTLAVILNQELDPGVTHVASIGAKAADRRGNTLSDSFLLVFSTGPVLENKRMTGRVLPGNFLGESPLAVSLIDVIAYRTDPASEPPDPENDVPDYMTQTGADGSFELVGLSRGTFRLFAVGDRDGDGFYTANYDLVGVASRDVVLAEEDSLAIAPSIMVDMRYTAPVQLSSARAPDRRRVELSFDREVAPETFEIAIPGLDILGSYQAPGSPRGMTVVSAPQEDGRKYEITRLEIADRFGNGMAELDFTPYFAGSGYQDTTALAVTHQIPSILTQPGEPVTLVFNRPLELPQGLSAILAEDERLSLAIDRAGMDRLTLRPVTGWVSGGNTIIQFDPGLLTGIAGNRFTEESARVAIRVAPQDTLAVLSGTVGPSAGETPVRIFAKETGTGEYRTVTADQSGAWTTGPILPGQYTIYGLRDNDGDSQADLGSVAPFRFAEPVTARPDTVLLQSRWPVGGIEVRFE